MSKNLFLGIKDQSGPRPIYVSSGLRTWAKAPSSQFYLIKIFSGPNPFSLMLLITFLLVCE